MEPCNMHTPNPHKKKHDDSVSSFRFSFSSSTGHHAKPARYVLPTKTFASYR